MIEQVDPADTRALRRFVALERQFLSGHPQHVSEIDKDVIRCLTGRSSFFDSMEYVLLQARNHGRITARCAALINRRYQRDRDPDVGFIGHFTALADHPADVQQLLHSAEQWLAQRGIKRIVAPCNGAAMLGMGLLSAEFEQSPMFPLRWNPLYYEEYFLAQGYQASYPFWIFNVDLSSDKYQAAARQVAANNNVSVRPINKKHWAQEMELLRGLFNETFKGEWEFHDQTQDEFREFFDPLKPILDPQQLLIGEVAGEPAGWCLGFPDWTPLFRSFRGRLSLPQIIKLMLRAKHYKRAGLVGIGVLTPYQGSGLAQALAVTLYQRYQQRGLTEALYYPVNDGNERSRRFAESLGGSGQIMYHCYDKTIA